MKCYATLNSLEDLFNMFSSSLRLLVRTQCIRSLCTISSAHKQRLLDVKPNLNKYLAGNSRYITDKINPFENVDLEDVVKHSVKKERRKTIPIPKITLLDTNKNMTVCTMEEAEKLALGRHLRLVKIVDLDARSKRPIYRLMTEAQYLEEELEEKKKLKKEKNKNSTLKGEKILILSCRINEHDLEMKIKRAAKWIKKKFEVRISISGHENDLTEQVRNFLLIQLFVIDNFIAQIHF